MNRRTLILAPLALTLLPATASLAGPHTHSGLPTGDFAPRFHFLDHRESESYCVIGALPGKPLVFSFGRLDDPLWAREAQFLQKVHKKYRAKGLVIFMVAMGEPTPAELGAFARQNKLTMPVGNDPNGDGE